MNDRIAGQLAASLPPRNRRPGPGDWSSPARRLDQIERLLDAEADAPSLLIAGDFNAQPESPEIDRMIAAGLVSAQDVSGDPSALTDPSINPDKRIDWVFGRNVSFLDTDVLSDALSSDHLPLVVTFALE